MGGRLGIGVPSDPAAAHQWLSAAGLLGASDPTDEHRVAARQVRESIRSFVQAGGEPVPAAGELAGLRSRRSAAAGRRP